MSKRLAPDEYSSILTKWTSVFSPVSARSADAWKADFEDAFRRLKYMQFARLSGGGQYDRMLNYRANLTVTQGVLEGVKADLEKIWVGDVGLGTTAHHTFVDNPSGFEFKTVAMNSADEFVTCRVLVVDSPKE